MVTAFHMCGLASAQASKPFAVFATADQDRPEQASQLLSESCHFCTVVSLPTPSTMIVGDDGKPRNGAQSVPDLVSFHPGQTSPPPRT